MIIRYEADTNQPNRLIESQLHPFILGGNPVCCVSITPLRGA